MIIAATLIFSWAGTSPAAVIDSGEYFLDTNTGWYWYSVVGEFANQDWETARDNIDNMVKGGMIWELASVSDIQTLGSYYIPDALLLSGVMRFTTQDKSVWGWLNDEAGSGGHKSVAGLLVEKGGPRLDSLPAETKNPVIGAFAVAKPN
jgi:hypothetical protein